MRRRLRRPAPHPHVVRIARVAIRPSARVGRRCSALSRTGYSTPSAGTTATAMHESSSRASSWPVPVVGVSSARDGSPGSSPGWAMVTAWLLSSLPSTLADGLRTRRSRRTPPDGTSGRDTCWVRTGPSMPGVGDTCRWPGTLSPPPSRPRRSPPVRRTKPRSLGPRRPVSTEGHDRDGSSSSPTMTAGCPNIGV